MSAMKQPGFLPQAFDYVEFLSDQQTEKGPSSGRVISTNYTTRTCVIQHSDHPGETFNIDEVRYERLSHKPTGESLWILE